MKQRCHPSLLKNMCRVQVPKSVMRQLRATSIHKADRSCQLCCRWQTGKMHKTAHRFQRKHASYNIASWASGLYQKQTKAKKNDLGNSVWPLPSVEMLPRSLQTFHWNCSLNLLLKQNSSYDSHSGRMFSCCHHTNNEKGCSFCFVWLRRNFYSLFQLLAKMGNSSRDLGSHDFGLFSMD